MTIRQINRQKDGEAYKYNSLGNSTLEEKNACEGFLFAFSPEIIISRHNNINIG